MAVEESFKNALEAIDSLKTCNVGHTHTHTHTRTHARTHAHTHSPSFIYVCAIECTIIVVYSTCEQPLLPFCGPSYSCES